MEVYSQGGGGGGEILLFLTTSTVDCSQSPYFSVGFSRPVGFDGAAAILVCKSKRDLGSVSKLPRGGERSWELGVEFQTGWDTSSSESESELEIGRRALLKQLGVAGDDH